MSVDCAKDSYVVVEATASAARGPHIFQLLGIAMGAALLAGCSQSTALRNFDSFNPVRQASSQHGRTASLFGTGRVASVRKHTPFARPRDAGSTQIASHGVASFYTEGQQTASGEKFDTHQLTAAHPTLPFGTRLRVTNVATGRSVTVRVNDRGPFIPGRVVDLSHSAANALGMVESGTAKVRLDVVD
jgi:rare lipoprotein A